VPPAGFEPVIPAGELPQAHALYRADIRIGRTKYIEYLYFQILYITNGFILSVNGEII
jgi:hypothetical protein